VHTKETFYEKITIKSMGSQKNTRIAVENYDRFCQTRQREDICDRLQAWINYNHKRGMSPDAIKLYFIHVKAYLHHVGIKLDHYDIKENLNFPKKLEEEMYGLKLEEIQKILGVASYNKKCLYMAEIQSGLSTGEALKLRKKDFDLSFERPKITVPASYRKVRRGKTTFLGSEASKMIMPKLNSLDPNDFVYGFEGATTENEDVIFARYCDKAGLNDRYESTNRRKITLHSFRAYFITKISRFDENLAKKLAGQKGYLLQYDRLDDNEKLKLYLEVEPELFVYDNTKLKLENSKLRSENITIESLNERLNNLTKIMAEFTKEHTHPTQLSDSQ
jgi:integrase